MKQHNIERFYINYEECKWIRKEFARGTRNCFILTMRNVNKKMEIIQGEKQLSFILTMRNVNKEAVYKVLHGADSFILTMENAIYI